MYGNGIRNHFRTARAQFFEVRNDGLAMIIRFAPETNTWNVVAEIGSWVLLWLRAIQPSIF